MKDPATPTVGTGTHRDPPVTGVDVDREKPRRPMGHRLMMLAMCFPMLVVVGVLVLTGDAGGGAVLYALLCTTMMAAMMMLMPGDRH